MIYEPNIPDFPDYHISKQGDLFSFKGGEWRLLRPTCVNGYKRIGLRNAKYRKSVFIHVLVATVYLGERPHKYQACHIDGNKLNNDLINIKWASCKENQQDKIRHGTMTNGSLCHLAKIHETEIEKIFILKCQGKSLTAIAKIYSTHPSTILQILQRKNWKHVKINRKLIKKAYLTMNRPSLSRRDREEIFRLRKNNYKVIEISKILNKKFNIVEACLLFKNTKRDFVPLSLLTLSQVRRLIKKYKKPKNST